MNAIYSFAVLLLLFCATSLWASDTSVDGIWYDFNSSAMTATVTYRGSSEDDYSNEYTGNVTIPESVTYISKTYRVTSIGWFAFSGCTGLTSVTIPNSVTSIGDWAFSGCTGLTSIVVENGNTKYDGRNNCNAIIETATNTLILGCESTIIPNSVTSIGDWAFDGCTGLTSIEIPNSVTSIGDWAFSGCTGLTSVTIPNSVTSIGGCAFSSCTSLTSIIVESGNSFYDSRDNCNAIIKTSSNTLIAGSQNTIIPNSVTSIEGGAFSGCTGLTSVTIPNSVTSIGGSPVYGGAFESCISLNSVTIPNSVTSIGDYAFDGCTSLTSVTIPNSVTSIGDYAFYNCSSLISIVCKGATPATIQSNTFPTSAIFYVPNCAYTTFHNAPIWKDFNVVSVSVNLAVMNNTGGVVVENCGQMEIEAIPYIGYQFRRWQDGNKDNPRTIDPMEDVTYTAEFAKDTFAVVVEPNNPEWGTRIDTFALYQDNIEISAIPNYGYHFVRWNDDISDTWLTVAQAYSRTKALDKNEKTSAQYTIYGYIVGNYGTYTNSYYMSDSPNESGSFIAFKTNQSASIGDFVAVTGYLYNYKGTTPETYQGGSLKKLDLENPRVITVTEDVTYTAYFAKNTYNITKVTDEAQGAITGAEQAEYLDEVELTAISNYGYHFTQWSDGNTDNPRTFVLTCDTTFTAEFAKNACSITKVADEIQGTISGAELAEYLDEVELTAISNYGYHFTQWSDGITDNPRKFVIKQDTTFTAEFAKNSYSITKVADEVQGTISGAELAEYLDEVELSAIPNDGHHFTQWSDGNTDNPRTFILTCDTTFAAEFAKDTYYITKVADEAQGAIVGAEQAEYLDEVELSAIPNDGHHFTQWSDGNTDNPRTFILTCDTTFAAEFAKDTYYITKVADEAQGAIVGAEQAEYLDEVELTAIPNYGYHFTQWSDGITDNPRKFVIKQDTTFTAEFAKNSYSITKVADEAQGAIVGAEQAEYLDEVELSAIPNDGHHFTQWSDGNTDNPRTFILTCDTTFAAEFAKDTYYITKVADEAQGAIVGAEQAKYLDEVELTATPNYGYHFIQWSDGNTENPRTFVLTQDTTFTAQFAKNSYSITKVADEVQGAISGAELAKYLDEVELTAIPNYGYHFTQWSDGNTDNPRTFILTCDTTFAAEFAKDTYYITKVADEAQGAIYGAGHAEYQDEVELSVEPDYGYHFTQWSDGNTDNPRTFVLTCDTTFAAEFAKNSYSITTASSNEELGTTAGDTTVLYQEQVEISATATKYGYHFYSWNDGNSSNSRIVTVTEDATYTATFAKNTYYINKVTDNQQGKISGYSRASYLDQVTLTAVPNYGYHFTQWSDGLRVNPRTFELTQDTTFTAEFAVDKYGTCGDNNVLMWTFDAESKTLAISGEGRLNTNYTFGVEAPSQTERLIIGEGVTSIGNNAFKNMCSTITSLALPCSVTTIGDYAFAGLNNRKFNTLVLPNTIISIGAHAFDGASYLKTIHFGSVLEVIGDYAFNGCVRVQEMTCLAEITPNVGTDGLTSINSLAKLYVPYDYLFEYQIDPNWSRFVLTPMGATETTVTTNDVTVDANDNSVTLTWPTSNTADSYTINITKDGKVFCQLIFDANGQLTGIAFAPSRSGQSMAPAATMTAAGMQFTVTGLNSSTSYGYMVEAKSGSTTVASYSGEFETTGAPAIATGADETNATIAPQKVLRNGKVFILRDGKTYTIQGREVK